MVQTKSYRYELGGYKFSKWEDVHAFARTLLAKGARVLKGKEFEFAKALLDYHPCAEKKKKNGILSIEVDIPSYGTHFCFHVIDNQGQREDFSYKKCTAKNKSKSQEDRLDKYYIENRLRCYREAVSHQTREFYSSVQHKCQHCGTTQMLGIDHLAPSFLELVNNFEREYKPTVYPKTERYEGVQTIRFRHGDRESVKFKAAWQKYHQKHAVLQVLCASCNAKKGFTVRYQPYLE